MAGKKKK